MKRMISMITAALMAVGMTATVFAAELLVRPSVADLLTAVQTLRHYSQFPFVPHYLITFSPKYRHKAIGKSRGRMQIFPFFKKVFTNL